MKTLSIFSFIGRSLKVSEGLDRERGKGGERDQERREEGRLGRDGGSKVGCKESGEG